MQQIFDPKVVKGRKKITWRYVRSERYRFERKTEKQRQCGYMRIVAVVLLLALRELTCFLMSQ